jgi:single-strand DNA-binding protein
MNKVILIGRVGKEPETKHFDTWQTSSFTLATSKKYRDKYGQLQEITEWHNIVCPTNVSKIVDEYVKKGDLICVEGEIRYRSYDTQSGKRYITEIAAYTLKMLSSHQQKLQDSPATLKPIADDLSSLFEYKETFQKHDDIDDLPFD